MVSINQNDASPLDRSISNYPGKFEQSVLSLVHYDLSVISSSTRYHSAALFTSFSPVSILKETRLILVQSPMAFIVITDSDWNYKKLFLYCEEAVSKNQF